MEKLYFAVGYLIGTLVMGICWAVYLHFHKANGELLIGHNDETGKVVYRFEYYDQNSIPTKRTVSFKVIHTSKNLGINQRLYDISDE